MTRFIGTKNNKIYIVSDKVFTNDELEVIALSSELDDVNSSDLLTEYKVREGKVVLKTFKGPAKDLKIAFIGNWKMRCGIATYSENLWPEVAKHVGDFKLFIEENPALTGDVLQFGAAKLREDQVVTCWKRGESLQQLIHELKEYNPDIIWIQHEFGLWSNARYWLSFMNQISEYRVMVTMHSVFHHKDKIICEAAMPEIVVHLDGAYKVLKEEKEVPGDVYVIAHGCFPCDDKERLWNFYRSEKTFMQFGFGFRYKGWELSLRAVALLKDKYPDIFFTGLFSESPFNKMEHEIYYNELMDLANELGIQENIAIIRGYQSDATLDAYLRTNKATVFPYTSHPLHEVFGASGAARVAMSKAIPVITSSVNHFSDLPSIKADTPEDIAVELEKLFSDWKARSAQVDKQINYINDNTWEKVALQYIALFERK